MELSIENLHAVVNDFRNLIGQEAFKKLVGQFDPANARGLRDYYKKLAAAHPFAPWWNRLQKDVTKSLEVGALALSDSSVFMLDLYMNLLRLKADPNFSEFIEKLASPNQFHATVFEVFIFAACKDRGFPIQVVPRDAGGERTPDFQISEGALFLECKSLQDTQEDEAQYWFEICGRVSRELLKRRLDWRVTLCPTRYIQGVDIESILDFCRAQMDVGAFGSAVLPETLVWKAEAVGDQSRRTDFGWVESESQTDSTGVQVNRLVVVEVDRYFDPDLTGRIQKAIEDARGQFMADAPSVLYIQVPHRSSTRLLEVADHAFDRTFGRLAKSYPEISCVVLIGRFLDPKVHPGGNPVVTYYSVMPNPSAKNPIPVDFPVLGAEGKSRIEEVGQGTQVFEFGINEPLLEQTGRSLIYECSHDGRSQMRAWQSFENLFRIEVVQPQFGRRLFKADLNDLEVGRAHKLAMSFSNEGISIAMNGSLLQAVQ